MPVDANIILQGQRQAPDAMEGYGKMLTLKSLIGQQQLHELQTQKYQRDLTDEQTLADIYSGAIKPDGTVDRNAVLTGAASRRLGAKIPAMQEQFLKVDKEQSEVEKNRAGTKHSEAQTQETQLKTMKQRLDMAGGAISSLLTMPNVTADHVVQKVVQLVQQGIIDQAQGGDMIRQIPANPQALRQFLMQKGLETVEAGKRIEMMLPKVEYKDTGKALQPVDTNPITTPNPVTLQKTTTPGEDLSASVTVRGQNVTDSRERTLAAQAVTYHDDGTGNVVALPSKVTPGTVPKAAPVLAPGSGMQPLRGKGANLTEDQGKATAWLAQASNAYRNMQSVLKINPDAATPGPGDAIAAIPGGGALGNYLRSTDRQQFNQATSSLSEALLRAATGAGINKHEADQKIQELTPQWGDTEKTVKQKLDAIPVFIDSLKVRAGPGAQKVNTSGTTASTTAPAQGALGSGTVDFRVPTDIDAIIRKHSGGR